MSEENGRGRGRARGRAKPPSTKPAEQPQVNPDQASSNLATQFRDLRLGQENAANCNRDSNVASVGRGAMRGGRHITAENILITRPQGVTSKKGNSGSVIKLTANYFPIISREQWQLIQYRVDFSPEIDIASERKRLMRAVMHSRPGYAYLFDGTVMYWPHKEEITAPQIGSEKEYFVERENDGSQVRVTIKKVAIVAPTDAQNIQVFNILTRNALKMLNLHLINRGYFDPKAKVEVREHFLELWPGYSTSIRQHENEILMCANIEHKVMRTDTCLHLLNNIGRNNPQNYKEEFARAVIGSVVLTDYNSRTYSITDVNWDENPESEFDKQGTKVSYLQYYKERYNINLRDRKQPLLVSRTKPRDRRAIEQRALEQVGNEDNTLVYLIPELCRMTGLTDEMRSNFHLMQAMALHTRINPKDRIKNLMALNERMTREEKVRAKFQEWSLDLGRNLVNLTGRVLQQETIIFGNDDSVPAGENCDWTRHFRGKSMFVVPQGGLQNWVFICPRQVINDARSFIESLIQAASGMRFRIATPQIVEMADDRTTTYMTLMDKAINECSPTMVTTVLMRQNAEKYSAIKKKSLVDRAVPTQVVLARNLNKKGVMSICTKIAIQMNCKIGGAPWAVRMPLSGLMVVGFDVCHDSKSKGKSHGAMVASLNKPMSRYYSAVSHHTTGEELSNDIAMNLVKAIQCYRNHNGALPSHIVIYRDGVGDGQIPYVYRHEVKCIVGALKQLYPTEPKLSFIIVSKRINTRIFFNERNPMPGTVVDDVITLPERYDFFIVSQFVTQGTVTPTSYNVIYDTLGLDPDKIQRLTFKLTHCYYNWSGTVRVPAPCQYAHKLAFLVSQSLHRAPNSGLNELLYFL